MIGDFFEPQELHEGFVGTEFFDVGEARSAGAVAENGGDDVNFGIEATMGIFAMIEFRVF